MPDTPALPPLPDLNRLEKRLNDATPDDLQPYERPDISVSCALALIAHVRALREALQSTLAAMEAMHPLASGDMSDADYARLWNAAMDAARATLAASGNGEKA